MEYTSIRNLLTHHSALLLVTFFLQISQLNAAEGVLRTEQLAANVYALVGPTTDRNPQNLGNNANFGVIVTEAGVVLVDPGANRNAAMMIHESIRAITDQPVVLVINTGGQDHRWLGNAYFKALGARIIASEQAVADQKARLQAQWTRLENLIGAEGMAGTETVHAAETFTDEKVVEIGGMRIHVVHAGQAHTPGDAFVWLPAEQIVFSGDIVYMDRMLRIGSHSAHRTWIDAFQLMADKQPQIVVPGHGKPAPLSKAKADTLDYLVFLRETVSAFIDEGNGMEDIGRIDQSGFQHLANSALLSGRNAQRVYEELEWE